MNQYHARTMIREEKIDGVGPWVWPAEDTGVWSGPKDDWITSHKGMIEKHCKDYKIVVQAGGACGMYPRLLAEKFLYVYTFEPFPLNFYCLTQNCQNDNVFKCQGVLGNSRGTVTLKSSGLGNSGMHKVMTYDEPIVRTPVTGDMVSVPAYRIDDLELWACSYIMLDVEGYESEIIRGAIETIKRYKPLISCENGNALILEQLAPFGYELVGTSKADAFYASKDWSDTDLAALPVD
jgi:FkbM family methyltransferase